MPRAPQPPIGGESARTRLDALASHYHRHISRDTIRIPCPAHAGNKDSLALWVNPDRESIGAKCWSKGCSYKEIAEAVERETGVKLGFLRNLKQTWDYRNRKGQTVTVERTDGPGQEKRFIGPHNGVEGPFLVRLFPPEGGDSDGDMVVLVEGERTAMAIAAAGFTGATWKSGAGQAGNADYSPLAGRPVVIWADDDTPGRKALADAHRALLGIAASILVVEVLGGETKEDAYNFPPDEIIARVAAATEWTPPEDPEVDGGGQPPDTDNVAEFLAAYRNRLMVVDARKLYLCRANGLWIDATEGNPTVTGEFQGMVRAIGLNGGQWGQRGIDNFRTALYFLIPDPKFHGILEARSSDFDNAPVLQLRGGGAIDLRTLEVLDAGQTAQHLLLDHGAVGLDYRAELLDAPPDHAGPMLAAHYEPDPSRPLRQLLRRIAHQLLGPHKSVDAIIMPLSDSGKTTFCRWVSRALPGCVAIVDAVNILSGQGQKFTAAQLRLAQHRLVFLDEADKIVKPPSAASFNMLAGDELTVEPKGRDSYELPRLGNAIMVGADVPNLELGQGGSRRLEWVFDGKDIPVMSPDLRCLVEDSEAQAWLATTLVHLAHRSWLTGDNATDGDSRKAAAQLHHELEDPLYGALAEVLEKGAPADQVVCAEIKTRLTELVGDDTYEQTPPKTFKKAMRTVFPHSESKRDYKKKGNPTVYTGIRFR